MASSMAITINMAETRTTVPATDSVKWDMAETRTTVPATDSVKWAQVRGDLSRAEQGHLDDQDIGPERAWRMCRSYRKSQAELPPG